MPIGVQNHFHRRGFAVVQCLLQFCQFSVKFSEKYFSRNYCATIRQYSAIRHHYSLPSFSEGFSSVPTRETRAIIRPFTRRGNSNFPCAWFFVMTQNALWHPRKIRCWGQTGERSGRDCFQPALGLHGRGDGKSQNQCEGRIGIHRRRSAQRVLAEFTGAKTKSGKETVKKR